ncbi:hypothetical protein LTR95_017373, partial [Oleoguttula sp. CCFEE 5521]
KTMRYNAILAFAGAASAGTVLWDGRANQYADSSFLDSWSFSNQVGPYQWYIHGSGATKNYVNLGTSYKNTADTGSNQGIRITNDKTSIWNGQSMQRTELIPQTSAAINKGKVYYHFSIRGSSTDPTQEHQIAFFESHFTELKYGLISGASGTSDNRLQWYVGGQSKWATTLDSSTWHNIAYGIDFSANTVEFYHSTGSDALTLIAGPVSASTSSNGADWHLGVLRLTTQGVSENWDFSGVYIESGSLTTSIVSPGGAAGSSSSSTAVASTTTTTTKPTTSSTTTSTTLVTTSSKAVTTSPTTTTRLTTTTTSSAAPNSSCKIVYVYV